MSLPESGGLQWLWRVWEDHGPNHHASRKYGQTMALGIRRLHVRSSTSIWVVTTLNLPLNGGPASARVICVYCVISTHDAVSSTRAATLEKEKAGDVQVSQVECRP